MRSARAAGLSGRCAVGTVAIMLNPEYRSRYEEYYKSFSASESRYDQGCSQSQEVLDTARRSWGKVGGG